MVPANSAKSSISFFRKCIARPTPCFPKRPAWKAKPWRLPDWRWRSKRRSKNCANRYKTSNERRDSERAAGLDSIGALRLRQIYAGAEDSRAAGHHAFDLLYYQAASSDGVQWEML